MGRLGFNPNSAMKHNVVTLGLPVSLNYTAVFKKKASHRSKVARSPLASEGGIRG